MPNEDPDQNFKKGSDNILAGLLQLIEGVRHISRSLGMWFDDHRLLKWLILTPVSAIVGKFIITLLNAGYVYFYGATVPISRDVMLGVFPAPVGLTLWILVWVFTLFALLIYFKFVTLRQRLERIESQFDE